MTRFELCEPASLGAALGLLDSGDPAVRPMAGGTALMLLMKAGVFRPTRIVSLRAIERQYSEIETTTDGDVRIGAMATLSGMERSMLVRRDLPVVAETLRALSNVRVRNVATLGGHLAHADPHMDLPPVLIALGARVFAAGPAGGRMIPAEDLIVGYYDTVLASNELITEVRVPAQGARRAAYFKCTTRSADDWPALGVAVVLDLEGGLVRDAHVVAGAATARPTRLTAAEGVLRGASMDDRLLHRAGEAAVEGLEIVSDARGSAAYKRELLRVAVRRAIRQCVVQ